MQKNNRLKLVRLMITTFLCVVLLVSIVPRTKSVWELSARKKVLETQKAQIKQVNQEKQKQLDELKSPEAIERIAREQLGMVKDGERYIIKVID